jgi:UDP-N-acetylmuramate dehydrogenase
VFRNPDGDHAGRLVEAAGLKGRRSGGAEISTLHANFIVTDKGARAIDVVRLMALMRREVKARFGVELHPEQRLIGFGDESVDRLLDGVTEA